MITGLETHKRQKKSSKGRSTPPSTQFSLPPIYGNTPPLIAKTHSKSKTTDVQQADLSVMYSIS